MRLAVPSFVLTIAALAAVPVRAENIQHGLRVPRGFEVTEFADSLLAHTVSPAEFTDYIRGLGFAICRVLPNFRIRLVPAGEALSGFNYCLLTRTPEEDIRSVEERRKFLPIRFKRWLDRHPVRWGWRRIWARW